MESESNPPGEADQVGAVSGPSSDKKVVQALDLLQHGLDLRKGMTLQAVGIGLECMEDHAEAAQRVNHDRHYGITRIPY